MSKLLSKFLIFLMFFIQTFQHCEIGKNFCVLCDFATDLCKNCESELFQPDEKGGCAGSKKCNLYQNHCLECSSSSYLCEKCDEGYFPDNNGGCATITNCEVSENGNCKLCQENYTLIYNGKNYMECISTNSEELLNCEEYDNYGHCLKCKENYYLNIGDRKCSNTENCLRSTNGICDICDYNYYLDKFNKTNYLCKSNKDKNSFLHCSVSEDGENCDVCLQPYYLTVDKKCVKTNYCNEGVTGTDECERCIPNYYLSEDKYSCTVTQNCKNGYQNNGKCKICLEGYYNNLNDGKCYSNNEDNQFKYCQTATDKCELCIKDYYLGEDNKCSFTRNCSESNLGTCTKCIPDYHLGKDNKCTNIQNCIKSDYKYECQECEEGFFVSMDQCVKEDIQGDTFKNCKIAFYNQNHCSKCRDNYYLYQPDNLCYKQTDEFNKCSNVAKNSENKDVCTSCEDLYYLGEDGICSPIAGCAKSQDGKCLECYSGLCRNKQKGTCDQNSYIDEDDKEEPNNGVCFRCKETNDAGTQCTQCEDGYVLSNGFCTDKVHCVEESSDGKCTKCIRNEFKDGFLKSYCVNNKYGCVETVDGCLTCDDMYHFNYCTTCHYGFYFDAYYEFCYECNNGCSSCTTPENCGGCSEGYYAVNEATSPDSYDANCEQCIKGCKQCSNDLDCEICYEGYYLTNENPDGFMKCESCSTFCVECYDRDYCLKCMDGFDLVGDGDKIICQYHLNS